WCRSTRERGPSRATEPRDALLSGATGRVFRRRLAVSEAKYNRLAPRMRPLRNVVAISTTPSQEHEGHRAAHPCRGPRGAGVGGVVSSDAGRAVARERQTLGIVPRPGWLA